MRTIATLIAATILLVTAALAQPTVSAVLNGASFSAVVAPGTWITIFGSNFASAASSAQGVPLPPSLSGVSVTVGGQAAGMLYVSATQINALIPASLAIPANTVVPVVVTTATTRSSPYNIRLTRNAPAIFTRNGAGTGRALLFDANFTAVDVVGSKDALILYATGLGPTDASGSVLDNVDVYIGERRAVVKFAGLAPGFPGIYQLNVESPKPATDRVYLSAGGWLSNIADIAIRPGGNTANAAGSIRGLYPSNDPFFTLPPCVDDNSPGPCNNGQGLSVMLNAAGFNASIDLLPSAAPFDIAAVGAGGSSLISIDPAAGSYTASISTVSQPARVGDFSAAGTNLWDYYSCDRSTAVCLSFPANIVPVARLDPGWSNVMQAIPLPNTALGGDTINRIYLASGKLSGSRLVIDSQTNASLAAFGAFVQVPFGPFDKALSTFKLYIDGRLVDSKDVSFTVVHR